MSGFPATGSGRGFAEMSFDALGHEILAEKAAALGRAGANAERTVRALLEFEGDVETRKALLKQAAAAVYAYFVQRELCGLRRHDEIICELAIPREVLARLGAR